MPVAECLRKETPRNVHHLERPFVFTAWLKLANLLAVAAATREDLVVSHVALTVAGRLLWCAGGVKGSEINPEDGGHLGMTAGLELLSCREDAKTCFSTRGTTIPWPSIGLCNDHFGGFSRSSASYLLMEEILHLGHCSLGKLDLSRIGQPL